MRIVLSRVVVGCAAILVLVGQVAGTGKAQGTSQTPPQLTILLDLYEHGDYDAALAGLAAWPDLKVLRKRFAEAAPGWIAAGGPRTANRRLLVAATLALESARPAMERSAGSPEEEDPTGGPLIEWACQLLRAAGPPFPAERWWHLAALALIERSYDRYLLTGSLPPRIAPMLAARIQHNHGSAANQLAHSIARFPDEARFQLASIVGEEVHQTAGAWSWLSEPNELSIISAETGVWKRLADRYGTLTGGETVRAEAYLRAGVIHFRLGDDARALDLLGQVRALSSDAHLRYLSEFFEGKSLERAGRLQEAEAAYERALDVIPRAQSASTALATLRFLRDERESAFAIVQKALDPPLMPVDPWRLYWCGDCRLWTQYCTRLREAIER
jgi:tetratricopeptide (TPR) repeat protein